MNLSPMGAAAFAGTSVKVDRASVASWLGFDGLVNNSMFAVSSRSFVLETLAVLEILMVDLSRMAEELILWSSSEFGFVELGDEYSAHEQHNAPEEEPGRRRDHPREVRVGHRRGDRGVRHSKGPAERVQPRPPGDHALTSGARSTTPHRRLSLMAGMLASAEVRRGEAEEAVKEDMSTATELANELVRAHGVPFRQAHQIVGSWSASPSSRESLSRRRRTTARARSRRR